MRIPEGIFWGKCALGKNNLLSLQDLIFGMTKTLLSLIVALVAACSLCAQTTEEILARMDAQTDRFDKEGLAISWSDGITVWEYDSSSNELTIDYARFCRGREPGRHCLRPVQVPGRQDY